MSPSEGEAYLNIAMSRMGPAQMPQLSSGMFSDDGGATIDGGGGINFGWPSMPLDVISVAIFWSNAVPSFLLVF